VTTAEAIAAHGSRPRCSCHDWPCLWQARPSGGHWRCGRAQQLARKAERAAEQPAAPTWRQEANERDALDALRYQYPRLTDDELRAELHRQQQLARSGQLAP
jgi:hypothetical protein